MVDYLTLALSHGLLALALLRVMMRDDLDVDPADIAEPASDSMTDSKSNPVAAPRQSKGRQPHA